MTIDIIPKARLTTQQIMAALQQMRVTVAIIEDNCKQRINDDGVLDDHATLLDELDAIDRATTGIRKGVERTQWPSAADYAGV